MVEYVSKIMTGSYPDLEVTHNKSRDVNKACPGKMIPVSDQEIGNIRQKTKCLEAKGVVAKCNVCKQSFTTVWMVNNSLNIWKSKIPSDNIYNFNHPMSEERSDVYAMLFPYRNTALSKKKADSLKEKYYKVLNMIKFNEHDYYHRRSCSKKGYKCRFKTPNQVTKHNRIRYGKEESVWTRFDVRDRKVTSFKIMLKRNMGHQLLNTCSLGLSESTGYNTNVQVGDIRHIFYNTLYGSKSTQKDDTRGYIAV